MNTASNALPEDCKMISVKAIAEDTRSTPRTARRRLEAAGIPIVELGRQPFARLVDYRKHLAGSSEVPAPLVAGRIEA